MKTLRIVVALFLAWTASAATTSNDDSCDIGVAPAATLLLPYFEVDLDDPNGAQTIFTITNVTNVDRIARVTLWTDYVFPVLTFNVQLTGYGMQSINLYDVIARGVIGPPAQAARGRYSQPNPASTCGAPPNRLSSEWPAYLQLAFTEGIAAAHGSSPACYNVGGEHENAVGYATVDLVTNCSTNDPFAAEYWTEDLGFDNVFIGDYQQVDATNDSAQGGPMVHIRAIPEGGTPAERMARGSKLPRTFYTLFQPPQTPKLDGRQPLPSVFAARWITAIGPGFDSRFKIWREGKRGSQVTCATYDDNVTTFPEFVLFDDAENGVGVTGKCVRCSPAPLDIYVPATSLSSIHDSSLFPQLSNGATSGWLYLNLDNDTADAAASSNWVIASMRAGGRYAVDLDAAFLGNGCSAPAPFSEVTIGTAVIGPRP
jgi:hypothetical protein